MLTPCDQAKQRVGMPAQSGVSRHAHIQPQGEPWTDTRYQVPGPPYIEDRATKALEGISPPPWKISLTREDEPNADPLWRCEITAADGTQVATCGQGTFEAVVTMADVLPSSFPKQKDTESANALFLKSAPSLVRELIDEVIFLRALLDHRAEQDAQQVRERIAPFSWEMLEKAADRLLEARARAVQEASPPRPDTTTTEED